MSSVTSILLFISDFCNVQSISL